MSVIKNLLVYEKYLGHQIQVFLIKLTNKFQFILHKVTSRTNDNVIETNQEVLTSSVFDSIENINIIVETPIRKKRKKETQDLNSWLYRENHRLKSYKAFLSNSVKYCINIQQRIVNQNFRVLRIQVKLPLHFNT